MFWPTDSVISYYEYQSSVYLSIQLRRTHQPAVMYKSLAYIIGSASEVFLLALILNLSEFCRQTLQSRKRTTIFQIKTPPD